MSSADSIPTIGGTLKELWEKLTEDHELIITKDGQPKALLIDIDPETLEETLSEVRRALFSSAVGRLRKKAGKTRLSEGDMENIKISTRKSRG